MSSVIRLQRQVHSASQHFFFFFPLFDFFVRVFQVLINDFLSANTVIIYVLFGFFFLLRKDENNFLFLSKTMKDELKKEMATVGDSKMERG